MPSNAAFDEILEATCFYKVLGVARDAPQADLRRAYLKKSVKTHPDKNVNDATRATQAFQKVAQAYDVLGDPSKRARYDMVTGAGGTWDNNGPFGAAGPDMVPVSPTEAFAMFTEAMEQYARENGIETERQETVFDSLASGLLAVDRWWFGEQGSDAAAGSTGSHANQAGASSSSSSSDDTHSESRLQGWARGLVAVGSFMSTMQQIHEAQRLREEEEQKLRESATQPNDQTPAGNPG